MKRETYLLFDTEGNIRVYSLTKDEFNLIEDIFYWVSPEGIRLEKLADMSFYERKEN